MLQKASAPDAGDRLARRNVVVLAAAGALAGANASVIFATGAIVGSTLAPDPGLATLPITIFVLGMASGTLPAGMIARRWGRRRAFLIGAFCGALMGVLGSLAVIWGSFPLFTVATFFGGVYAAVTQSYRFAAADTASDAFKPKAISWVMAGGVLAGVIGPQLVQLTMDSWAPYLFAASYAAQAGVALVAMAVLSLVRIPKPQPVSVRGGGRPLLAIIRKPQFATAMLCGLVSYALMNLVMTSAPLAMKMCGHSIADSNLAIQWHVIAMYAPSFVTGSLISRFGAPRVIAAGLLLLAAAAVVDIAGVTVAHFWTGMILLGLGWNLGFVGASTMVAQSCAPAERNTAQAFNDFAIFGTMAVGSFSSGQLLAHLGWTSVNGVVFPPVLMGFAALLLFRRWKNRQHRAV
ncbi:MFS transporter [Alsobacter sp. SYSU M60028]|uniref:MFS transporter n=1 Tax=Alsobacter ponti TaxID=2962936 RepID=A0ABT1LB67_9HYPH|nr:MFS transporter [Alsobacter ponti]MCP8938351.1 MFS transporter [Alsobacter ponti]